MVYPAVCNKGIVKRVAERQNALSETEKNLGRERKHHQKKTKSINPERRRPKGINLREGKCRGGRTPPPRANP